METLLETNYIGSFFGGVGGVYGAEELLTTDYTLNHIRDPSTI